MRYAIWCSVRRMYWAGLMTRWSARDDLARKFPTYIEAQDVVGRFREHPVQFYIVECY